MTLLALRDDGRRRRPRAPRRRGGLRRHRSAQPGLQSRARAPGARPGADLRVGRGGRGARAAAGLDRRSVAGHRLADGLQHGGRVPALPAEREDRGGLPRRGAGRPLRQHQHDGDRQLREARRSGCPAPAAPRRSRSTPSGCSSSAGSIRRAFPAQGRFPHQSRSALHGQDSPGTRHARRRPGQGDHRQGHPRDRSRNRRDGAHCALSRRHGRRREGQRRLAAPRPGTHLIAPPGRGIALLRVPEEVGEPAGRRRRLRYPTSTPSYLNG